MQRLSPELERAILTVRRRLQAHATPATRYSLIGATVILAEESEPQPDLALRVLTECGGQSWVTEDNYYAGAPELIAEIAHSSRAIDLNQKREDMFAVFVTSLVDQYQKQGRIRINKRMQQQQPGLPGAPPQS